ncbi:MAG: hypothetical protein RSC06_00720 [Clostridia bacterium]
MPDENELLTKVLEEQARMSEQIKGALRRIDEQKKLIESVQDLALSVKLLAQSQKGTESKVDVLSKDVETLKAKPAKKWESLVEKVIFAVVGGVIAYLMTRAGL